MYLRTSKHRNRVLQVFLFAVLSSWFIGCSSAPKQDAPAVDMQPVDPALDKKFNEGLKALEEERYRQAVQIFDSILVQNPASEFDLIALYNSAAAYEGLSRCKTAGRRYRQVARTSAGRYPRVEAMALFRLSYAYECLGYPQKVIASLLDVQRRKEYLSEEVVYAEVPARLAASYAQLGQLEVAKKYFDQAEAGIQRLRRIHSQRPDLVDLLARTYFFMGRVQARQETDVKPQGFFQSLRFQQAHLIKAVELESDPWSRKASETLLEAYRDLWEYLEQGRARRANASYQERRQYVLDWVEGGQQALAELKTLRFPRAQEGQEAKRMFSQLEEEERRMQEFLAEFAVSHPLTPEAESREGIKREGKVKTRLSPLEKEAIRRQKLPEKKVNP